MGGVGFELGVGFGMWGGVWWVGGGFVSCGRWVVGVNGGVVGFGWGVFLLFGGVDFGVVG